MARRKKGEIDGIDGSDSEDGRSESGHHGGSKSGRPDSKSKMDYRAPKKKTKLSFNEQREYDNIEDEINKLEERSKELDLLIADSATDYSKLMEYTKEKEAVDLEAEQKLERYLELQEMVDSFSGA